jgi:hypothetical protein
VIESLLIAAVIELLPLEDIYPPYLAAPKEPRIGDVTFWEPDAGWLWDISLGGRGGLVRVTFSGVVVQIDLEGATFLRLDLDDRRDLISSEFKYGTHLFIGLDGVVFRLGYQHLSAHLGDEALRSHPDRRPNGYSRDTFLAGVSFHAGGGLRLYGQVGFAPVVEGPAEPWEIDLGVEWSIPAEELSGRPFAAVHSHLRQENEFVGNFTAQAGWHWRTSVTGSTFRVGVHFHHGPSTQYQFYEVIEQQLGLGTWFDF